MTNNEAKGRLESFIDTFNICKEHDNSLVAVSIMKEDIQAFTMAIEALKQKEKTGHWMAEDGERMKEETVEVLVKIPKKDFEQLQGNYVWWGKHGEYIKKGTVLPKNYGRLIDADAYLKDAQIKNVDDIWIKESFVYESIINAPTVIEADKGGE